MAGAGKVSIPKLPGGKTIISNAEYCKDTVGASAKKSLAVDFGQRRTGLAVSYEGFSPRALNVLYFTRS